jgi:hypothetical protein
METALPYTETMVPATGPLGEPSGQLLPVALENGFDGHRPGVLAEEEPHPAAHRLRLDDLVDRGVDGHPRGVDAGLVAEDVVPDDRLGGADGDAAILLHLASEVPEHVVAEAGDGDPVELLQDHDRGVERRVARALAEPVHGAGRIVAPWWRARTVL